MNTAKHTVLTSVFQGYQFLTEKLEAMPVDSVTIIQGYNVIRGEQHKQYYFVVYNDAGGSPKVIERLGYNTNLDIMTVRLLDDELLGNCPRHNSL